MTPFLLTIKETTQALRITRAKVYLLIETRALEGFKVGADWRVRRDSVEKMAGKIPDEFFLTDNQGPDVIRPVVSLATVTHLPRGSQSKAA